MEISQDVNFRPIIFIRFNPDGYYVKNKFVSSCWVPNKLGVLVIPTTKTVEWEQRLDTLKNEIQTWIKKIPEKTIDQVQLFYDS
jgi:hypothetical protein